MEMLLVTVLVSMTGLAVFQAFNNGLKLWAKGVRLDHAGDAAIALDKLGDDLGAAICFSRIPFTGTATRLSFASIVSTLADRNGSRSQEGTIDQIGAIEYYFDAAEGKIFRRQANYGQALKRAWGPAREIMPYVDDLNFHYYYLSEKRSLGKPEADGDVPAGVELEIRLHSGVNMQVLKRYFAVPIGG